MKMRKEFTIIRIFVTNCFDESYVGSEVKTIRCCPDMLDLALKGLPIGRNMRYSTIFEKEVFEDIVAEILVFRGNKLINRIKPEIEDHL
jgi:hypothetical protein